VDSALARPAALPASRARLSNRGAVVALFIAVAVPIPALTASGLSLPLPGFVARAAFALAPGDVDERAPASKVSRSLPAIAITRTATELARARARAAPARVDRYRGTAHLVAAGHKPPKQKDPGPQVTRHEVRKAGSGVSQAGVSQAWLPPPSKATRDPDAVLAPPAAPGNAATAATDESGNPSAPGQTTPSSGGNPAPPGQTTPPGQAKKS
jgi:hypothetical protein